MELIKFTENTNGKLDGRYFTTLRIGSFKYAVGRDYGIVLNNKHVFIGQIVSIKIRMLWEFDDFDFLLESGYDKNEAIKMFVKMYSDKELDKTRMFLLLIKRLDVYNKLQTPIV